MGITSFVSVQLDNSGIIAMGTPQSQLGFEHCDNNFPQTFNFEQSHSTYTYKIIIQYIHVLNSTSVLKVIVCFECFFGSFNFICLIYVKKLY